MTDAEKDPQEFHARAHDAIQSWADRKWGAGVAEVSSLESDSAWERYHVTLGADSIGKTSAWHIVWIDLCHGSESARVVKSEPVASARPPTLADVVKGGEVPVEDLLPDAPEVLEKIRHDIDVATVIGERMRGEAVAESARTSEIFTKVLRGEQLPPDWEKLAGVEANPRSRARAHIVKHGSGLIIAVLDYIESLR